MLFKFIEFIFVVSLDSGTFCRRTNVLAEIPRPLSEGKRVLCGVMKTINNI
jgi:hypothetical protein